MGSRGRGDADDGVRSLASGESLDLVGDGALLEVDEVDVRAVARDELLLVLARVDGDDSEAESLGILDWGREKEKALQSVEGARERASAREGEERSHLRDDRVLHRLQGSRWSGQECPGTA